MRVAVFTNEFPSESGTFFVRDMQALIASGVEIEIFPTRPINPKLWRYANTLLESGSLSKQDVHHVGPISWDLLRPKRTSAPMAEVRAEASRIIADARRSGPTPLLKTVHACLQGAAWLSRDSRQFDAVFAYWGNHPGTTAYLASRFAEQPLPLILGLQAHDLFYNRVHFHRKLQHTARILVPSEYSRDYLLKLHPELRDDLDAKTEIIPAGLDLDSFAFCPEDRPPATLIAIGRHHTVKGLDYLLRAVAMLSTQRSDLRLELVGDGPERRSLQTLAGKLGLADRVHFSGWIEPHAAREKLSRATLLVHPSSDLDALPNVVKEAMAVGTPVVASSVAGIPEMLDAGGCGLLVEPRNVEQLVNAIDTYLDDPKLRREHAERARLRCEARFDMWDNGRRLRDLLVSATHSKAI